MSGLIYKDLMNLRRYLRQLVVICILIVAIFFFMTDGGIGFIGSYIVMVSMMVTVNSMSYDNYGHWDPYALTLPLGRRQLVGSKYLLGLLVTGGGALFAAAMVLTYSLLRPGSLVEGMATVAACFLVALLLLALLLPLLYRFGVEKARMIFLIIFMGPLILALALSQLGVKLPGDLPDGALVWAAVAAGGLCLLAYPLSYLISLRIFERKEF